MVLLPAAAVISPTLLRKQLIEYAPLFLFVSFVVTTLAAVYLWATIDWRRNRAEAKARRRELAIAAREERVDSTLAEHVFRIRSPDGSSLPAALSMEVRPRLAEFLDVEDRYGVAELVAAGLVALLPAETMVRRIKVSGLLAEIRIEDGEHRGALAWTLASYLTKDRPQA